MAEFLDYPSVNEVTYIFVKDIGYIYYCVSNIHGNSTITSTWNWFTEKPAFYIFAIEKK